jgi:hypothetical protein
MYQDDVFMDLSSMLVGEMRYYQISLALALSVQLPNLNHLDVGNSRNISRPLVFGDGRRGRVSLSSRGTSLENNRFLSLYF